jgi:5-methyltetrahydrofolate--homocysteine methyltransferase
MMFRKALEDNQILIFDGGMGTLLQAKGLKPGQSPEIFGQQHPEVIEGIHKDYIRAGARVVTTNTFGGTRFKLGPDIDVERFNREMALVARKAAGDRAFVAGSVGPTGKMIKPLGDVSFVELVQAFKEQILGLVQGGVDLILGETHFDLAEARAVVVAAREVCDLPIGISMTFEQGASLTGTDGLTFIDTMQNMGVDMVATNCSAGPEGFLTVVREMLQRLEIPLLVEPNAGLPELENGQTVFRLGPQDFAMQTAKFVSLGVKALGGCCGTTPEHIRALCAEIKDRKYVPPSPSKKPCIVLTSRSQSVPFGFEFKPVIVGERINPTGKKDLSAELQAGQLTRAVELAQEQIEQGATVLDVNVGAAMVNEQEVLPALIAALVSRFDCPLCLDSSNEEAIREGLFQYPGSALVNSISGEEGKMDRLGPICRDFGAPFILLPLKGNKLPVTAKERLSIIESLLARAFDLNIPKRLILVDALALTVSSKPEAAMACLEVIRYCREKWNLGTIMGLSNISFGLPARELINSTFLAMCLAHGMTSFIANPNSARLQETLYAANVLLHKDPQAGEFIAKFSRWSPGEQRIVKEQDKDLSCENASKVQLAVIKGDKDRIVELLEQEVTEGRDPFELVDKELIPAITEVGEKYEKKEYFLPQLLLSAETMQKGFEFLRPFLEKKGKKKGPKVIMATVEGDIHDIGKNIVCLMLKNYGFDVLDLGKDVPAEEILRAVREHKAALVGLSALMTTTMVKMEDTIKLIRKKNIPCKVMVGGAVVTEVFAQKIGADGYASDAVAAVKLAQSLVEK